jgi:hypothetical protein
VPALPESALLADSHDVDSLASVDASLVKQVESSLRWCMHCMREFPGLMRCESIVLARDHAGRLTELSNVVAYVCRLSLGKIGIMFARLDERLHRHHSVARHPGAPDVDFPASIRYERIPGRHSPRTRNSVSRFHRAELPAIGKTLAGTAETAGIGWSADGSKQWMLASGDQRFNHHCFSVADDRSGCTGGGGVGRSRLLVRCLPGAYPTNQRGRPFPANPSILLAEPNGIEPLTSTMPLLSPTQCPSLFELT